MSCLGATMLRSLMFVSGLWLLTQVVSSTNPKCIRNSTFCYSIFETVKTWDNAETTCQSFGGHLTSITSQSEQDFIANTIKQRRNETLWIGYNDKTREANFVWSDGSFFYTNWISGAPNNTGNNEDCVEIQADTGGWDDSPCNTSMSYICKTKSDCQAQGCIKNGTFFYKFFVANASSAGKSWDNAENACHSLDGNLTSITSQSEQTFIANTIQQYGNKTFWIGFNDMKSEANFEWTDGSFSYTNWNENEPNNDAGGEDCTVIKSDNGGWSDLPCSLNKTFICKTAAVDIDCKSVTVSEGDGVAKVAFNRTGAISDFATTIQCATKDGSAKQSSDYIHKNTHITFAKNVSLSSFDVQIVDDSTGESDEMFYINCTTNQTNVNFLPSCINNNLKVEIKDNDISIDCQGATVNEQDGNATIVFKRTGAPSITASIFCKTKDGSAKHSIDYTEKNTSLTFGAGVTSRTFTIPILNDRRVESDEEFNIECSTSNANVNFLSSCSTNNLKVVIKDNDIDIDCKSARVNENDGNAVIEFNRTGATSSPSTIFCTTKDGTARHPSDYIYKNTSITFEAGQTMKTFNISVVNDRHVESNEVLNINCTTNNYNVDFLPSCLTNKLEVHITDDDIDIDCKSARVNETDGNATIEFTRSGALSYTTNIYCTTRDKTAKQPSDYTHKNSSITFGPLSKSSKTFTVSIANDDKSELDEELNINCTTTNTNVDFSPSCSTNNLTVQIINDDIHLRCLNATVQVTERSQPFNIMVKKEGLLHLSTSFWVQTVDGIAIAKADYEPINRKMLTFAPGEEYASFVVKVLDDPHYEKGATIRFNITIGVDASMSNYPTVVVQKHCSTISIKDDDIDTSSTGLTKKQAEELEKQRNKLIVLLSVGIGLICLTLFVLIVLVCCLVK